MVLVCPAEVPVTVKFKGFAVAAERLVTTATLDPPAGMEAGLNVHVAPFPHDKAMVFVNELGAVAEIVKVVLLVPITRIVERWLADREKTGVPVPARLTEEVPLTALEVTLTLPVRFPAVLGAKFTTTVHVPPTFREAGTVGKLVPQLLVSLKLDVAAMLVMVTGWLPLLTNTAVWLPLEVPTISSGNVNFVGVKSRDPPVRVPLPVKAMACVPALSLMVNCYDRRPVCDGVKVSWTAQVPPPPGNDTPQLLVCWKSPLVVMLLIVNAELPRLPMFTVWAVLRA